MHMVIRAIVYATNEMEAKTHAEGIFKQITENGQPFDYYTMFDNDNAKMSGKARWGAIPAVVRADSAKGKKLIAEGMEETKKAHLRALKEIRKAMKGKTDKTLFESGADYRYFANIVGQYQGGAIWLYDCDGAGVRNTAHLKNILDKWACNHGGKPSPEYKNSIIYVVPADVHY